MQHLSMNISNFLTANQDTLLLLYKYIDCLKYMGLFFYIRKQDFNCKTVMTGRVIDNSESNSKSSCCLARRNCAYISLRIACATTNTTLYILHVAVAYRRYLK